MPSCILYDCGAENMREMITFVLTAHTCVNSPEIWSLRHNIFIRLILEEKISLNDNNIRIVLFLGTVSFVYGSSV